MSDEMKNISEDGTNAAGDVPRRDSAQAAALTVGLPPSSSEGEKSFAGAGRKGLFGKTGTSDMQSSGAGSGAASSPIAHAGVAAFALKTKIGIAVVAAVSAAFIGVSAFAITGGFGLPADSPVIQVAERVGIVSVSQVQANATAASGHAEEGVSSESGDETSNASKDSDSNSKEESGDKEKSNDTSKSSDDSNKGNPSSANQSGSKDSDSSNAGSGQGDASSKGGNSDSPSPGAVSGNSNASSGSSDSGGQAPSNVVTVYVSVSSSAVGNPVSGGGTFSFGQGATVYDALCACGLSVNAGQTGYGIYVSAIGGLAEKEHGAQSGWMYSVNGVVPMTACSNYTLSDGDSVSWYYVTG